MKAVKVDPRDESWQDDDPVFRVYFWRRLGSANAYASDEFEIREADVVVVLAWAERERNDRTFTLYLRRDDGPGIGLILLAGTDPTQQ